MAQQFPHLFSPIKIGPMTVRNRIYSSPHHPLYNMIPGLLSDKVIGYWVGKAKGGIGMIGTQLLMIHPLYNEFRLPGQDEVFKKAADAVHQHGAKIIVQVGALGGQASGFNMPAAWSASAILIPLQEGEQYVCHELTKDEIKYLIDSFVYAAVMSKKAGMDGVELHGAHGYIFTQFMSPRTNKRTDEYGGSLENRMRFSIEAIEAVRGAVGDDFVVGMRISGDEFVEGGYTLDDMLIMAPMLAKTGKLDYLNVSAGTYVSIVAAIDPMYYPLNAFVYLASAIKQVVDIPVFGRGRITDPVQAEEVLAKNQVDMVSMVRAIMADPEWPNKVREGRLDEISKCLGCNEACWGALRGGALVMATGGISCVMNPALGRETEPGWGELEPAAVKKRVMIIGAGPAGLETARVAASRGHQVSLYDRGSEFGGQTLIAAKAPGRDGFLDLSRYYTFQMKLLNVDVHLNAEVTVEMVKEQAPDVVVVATGSVPLIPDIPGIDGDNVVEVRQVLNEEVEVGNKVVIIAGDDDIESLSTADFLAERGKKVEVICWAYYCGAKLETCTKQSIHQRLLSKGVILTPQTWIREISDNTVIAYNVYTHEEHRIEGVDTIVVACAGREDHSLYNALKDQVREIHEIGDANRKLRGATADGAALGRAL